MKLFSRSLGSIGSLICCLIATSAVRAQIVPDNTLPVNSSVEPGCTTCTIDGGTAHGNNLFHSFREFSVPTGGQAFFNNAPQIQNILTRVTGSSISNIDGLLRSNGTANLFLINPNGVIFGPNAQLNIGGSFVTSTASSILLENGFAFSATDPQAPPLLMINVPIGLQYGINAGSIGVQGRLQVNPGQTLALAGGEVALVGGALTAPGGRIELGSLAAGSLVAITPTNPGWQLNYQDVQQFQDIRLTQAASVDTSSNGGGSIQVQGRRLSLTEGSRISTATRGSQAERNTIVRATESVEVIGFNPQTNAPSVVATQASRGSTGKGGDLTIETGTLRVAEGAQVITNTFGTGKSGDLTVRAQRVEVVGFNPQDTSSSRLAAQTASRGNTGNLTIETATLRVAQGAIVTTRTFGAGSSGDITLRAQAVDVIGVHPQTGAPTFLGAQAISTGDAGNLTIETGALRVTDGAQVSTATFSGSNSGDLTVRAQSVEVLGTELRRGLPSLLFSAALDETGNAGNLTIETGTLRLTDGATVTTLTSGAGKGGDLTVRAQSVDVTGSNPQGGSPTFLVTQTDAIGNISGDAGNLTIETETLRVADGAEVSTTTFSAGKGGDLTVRAQSIDVIGSDPQDGSSSALATQTESTGNAGNLTIEARALRVTNGARVATDTLGSGKGGDLMVRAQSIDVAGFDPQDGSLSLLTAQADSGSTGNAGGIFLTTDRLQIANRGAIIATSGGTGSAGNIEIQAASRIALTDDARISSNTNAGQGNITLTTPLLLLRRGSSITTNAGSSATGGNIRFNGGFIVAVPSENSDITANAFTGSGGRVDITAQGIFGIGFRPQLTPLSDITASSEFGIAGIVAINTLNVDPSRGLAELPTDLTDASNQIVTGCSPTATAQTNRGEFFQTGRGGIAPLPTDMLGSSDILEDLQPPHAWTAATPPNVPIVEAQGLHTNDRGEVFLVATPKTMQNAKCKIKNGDL